MKNIGLALVIAMIMLAGPTHVTAETETGTKSDVISADALSSATGDTTHASAEALATEINGNQIVVAQSVADAKGKEISLISKAHATGKIVHGEGKVVLTGETTQSTVEALTEKIKEGIYSITVMVTGQATSSDGDAKGITYALAWAVDPKDPEQQPVIIYRQPFFGYIFGKSDAERYYAYRYQINKHLKLANNGTNDTAIYKHAIYWRDIMLNDYGLNASQFEHKYPLSVVIAMNPELVKTTNNSK